MRVVLVGFVAVSSIVSSVACVELPEGFEDAAPIEVVQHDCDGPPDPDSPAPTSVMAAVTDDNEVSGTLLNMWSSCSTAYCAYAVETDGVARVLFQPCEMHPFQEALCSCVYDIDFVAPFAPDVALDATEVWARSADVDATPGLIDRVDL